MSLLASLFFGFNTNAQKKNVLVFIVDDLGYYDLSSHGSKLYETPNIDKLAENGIEFTNAYVAHPRCLPSRYAIQTGKFPARAQIPALTEIMPLSEITIGQAFKQNGYHTFFSGKWHLGKDSKYWPQNRGYDINKGGCAAGAPISYFYPYNELKRAKYQVGSGDHLKIIGLDDGGKDGEYLTDRLTRETIKFINENDGTPFFAMLCHYGVHTPFEAPKKLIEKYDKKIKKLTFEGPEYLERDGQTKTHQDNVVYAAMIESVDQSLGQIIDALKEKGILNNTIIVFTSDHGGLSNRGNNRPLATSNLPLRAGKGHVYEGGIKVPFIIYDPEVGSGTKCNEVTINTDIYPTLLDLCDLPLLPEQHLDGMSMKTFMAGNPVIDRTLFWHSPKGRPIRTGDHTCSAVRLGNYKLINYYKENRIEVYDLIKDPYESNNLAETDKELTKKLLNRLNVWKRAINASN